MCYNSDCIRIKVSARDVPYVSISLLILTNIGLPSTLFFLAQDCLDLGPVSVVIGLVAGQQLDRRLNLGGAENVDPILEIAVNE